MEKATLNNEIVLCRSSIRKARVRIIRKKIKKIKILKSAKKDGDKEKKLKKAERLVEEVMLLKKVREDDVTKFALQNQNVASILNKTPANDHEHVYATIALFPDVQKRVQHIRDNIPDWESSLPTLLQHLGTRTMLKKWRKINKGTPIKPRKVLKPPGDKIDEERTDLASQRKKMTQGAESESCSEDSGGESDQSDVKDEKQSKNKKTSVLKVVPSELKDEKQLKNNKTYVVNSGVPSEVKDKKQSKNSGPSLVNSGVLPEIKEQKQSKNDRTSEVNNVIPEVKVDDPFFVSKKITLPKLLLSEVLEDPKKELKFSRDEPEPNRWSRGNQFDKFERVPRERSTRRLPHKQDEMEPEKPVEEEKLHPSWAAKKVKLIQPFQGKKIKFDLD